MANSYLPETRRRTAAIKKLQIATLIGDLSRKADILTADIEHEEARVGIRDMSDPAYSVRDPARPRARLQELGHAEHLRRVRRQPGRRCGARAR